MSNLLHEFTSWSPTDAQAPAFFKEDAGILGICSAGKPYCFGKWLSKTTVLAKKAYTIHAEYQAEDPAKLEERSVYALISWKDANGKNIHREFLIEKCGAADGWIQLGRVSYAPAGAVCAELELSLCTPGTVRWRNAAFTETSMVSLRPVRAASAFFEPRRDFGKNLDTMLSLADQAGQKQADVILFTESCYDRFIMPIQAKCVPITNDGDVIKQFSKKARQYNMNILVNLTEEESGFYFNTTVIINREGIIIGKYRKSHLPMVEMEVGFSPGNELPVFDMDFGTVGILTCFDITFPETGRTLRNKGAEVIFVPTIGNFLLESQMQARWNGLYVVLSGGDLPHPSRIISPGGDIIASVDGTSDGIAFAYFDLNQSSSSMRMGFYPATSDARNALLNQRRPDLYTV